MEVRHQATLCGTGHGPCTISEIFHQKTLLPGLNGSSRPGAALHEPWSRPVLPQPPHQKPHEISKALRRSGSSQVELSYLSDILSTSVHSPPALELPLPKALHQAPCPAPISAHGSLDQPPQHRCHHLHQPPFWFDYEAPPTLLVEELLLHSQALSTLPPTHTLVL